MSKISNILISKTFASKEILKNKISKSCILHQKKPKRKFKGKDCNNLRWSAKKRNGTGRSCYSNKHKLPKLFTRMLLNIPTSFIPYNEYRRKYCQFMQPNIINQKQTRNCSLINLKIQLKNYH